MSELRRHLYIQDHGFVMDPTVTDQNFAQFLRHQRFRQQGIFTPPEDQADAQAMLNGMYQHRPFMIVTCIDQILLFIPVNGHWQVTDGTHTVDSPDAPTPIAALMNLGDNRGIQFGLDPDNLLILNRLVFPDPAVRRRPNFDQTY